MKNMAQKSNLEIMADNFAHPKVYDNQSAGYARLSGLPLDEWVEFNDELGKRGFMCNYNMHTDTYTIG